jgi:hypothetical protein
MEQKIVNLTPHPLVFADGRTIESSGIARCTQTDEEVGQFADLPIVVTRFGGVVDLPAPIEGTAYVVSSITAQACVGRMDVFVPGRPIRDAQGRIIGCGALGRIVG